MLTGICILGALLLPGGDYSSISTLPEMYQHCKATEDPDMSFSDFLTDHLINIDGFYDEHGPDDQQKPHKPIWFQVNAPALYIISQTGYAPVPENFSIHSFYIPQKVDYVFLFSERLLRPPCSGLS